MDIKESIIKDIRLLQQNVKEYIEFSFTFKDENRIAGISSINPNILSVDSLLELYERLLIYRVESKGVTQEAFNSILDIRPYLLNSPKDYTQDCLHYLGDDAQKWWFERKFTERFKEVESLLEEHKVTEAFEKYLSFETVQRYRENASEQLDYLKKVNQQIGKGFNSSSEAEFLAILENFKFLLRLSKRHHLKIEL